jgi:5-methylcytosine-specific restriction endonuclease McrA
MTLHVCPGTDERGCPNLTETTRCPECEQIIRARRRARGVRNGSTGRWRRLRRRVLKRDGYRCVRCDAPYPLEVDHINGDPSDDRLENLRTLGVPCHKEKHRHPPRSASHPASDLGTRPSPSRIE